MNVAEFIEKWKRVELTERSVSQQHFRELRELLDHPPRIPGAARGTARLLGGAVPPPLRRAMRSPRV